MLSTSTNKWKIMTFLFSFHVLPSFLHFSLSCILYKSILYKLFWLHRRHPNRNSRRAPQSRASAQRSFDVDKWQGILHWEEILVYTIPAGCWTWNWCLQLWKDPSDSARQFSETTAAGCRDSQKKQKKKAKAVLCVSGEAWKQGRSVILPPQKTLVHPQLESWDISGLPICRRMAKEFAKEQRENGNKNNPEKSQLPCKERAKGWDFSICREDTWGVFEVYRSMKMRTELLFKPCPTETKGSSIKQVGR